MHGLRLRVAVLVVMLVSVLMTNPSAAMEFPGPSPGIATAELDEGRLVIENEAIRAAWDVSRGRLRFLEVTDRLSGRTRRLKSPEAFVLELADGALLAASQLETKGEPTLERLASEPKSVRQSDRFPGWKASVLLASRDRSLQVRWEIVLRDQSNYFQQQLIVKAEGSPAHIRKLTMIDVEVPQASVRGEVDGSPVAADNLFLACEHPMSHNRVEEGRVVCEVRRYRVLEPGRTWTVSSVVGVVPEGQHRRGFLYYLERERARPYGPSFYYISWFDIAYHDRKMHEQQCLKVIEDFGREMAVKRGVKPNAFVFDDGWDDNRTLWKFHEGFPNGFVRLQTAAATHGAVLGTWISPWGGYGKAKAERLRYGKEQGFEMAHGGFSLAGPKYFARFRDVCAEHIQKHGVRYFKFDGIGHGISASGPGEKFGADIEAMLDLIANLRNLQPDLFFNTTVGTWPSPYWLFFSDSIWRGGHDIGYHGSGSSRQQWLTYRDMTAYRERVLRAPLYPLNSLKSQSVICAQLGLATKISNDVEDLVDDIRMAAGSGTQLQEFFVTPSMLSPKAWDAMAESITWMRQNHDVLIDSHWIGGDPGEGEIYGYASWASRKGILVLRNPSNAPADITINLQTAFELPQGAPSCYRLKSVWEKTRRAEVAIDVSRPHRLKLQPLEVVVLEALPMEVRKKSEQ
ncbi:MAG: hypothetical protein ACC628_16030 [Pirellulaceae bacterium]